MWVTLYLRHGDKIGECEMPESEMEELKRAWESCLETGTAKLYTVKSREDLVTFSLGDLVSYRVEGGHRPATLRRR